MEFVRTYSPETCLVRVLYENPEGVQLISEVKGWNKITITPAQSSFKILRGIRGSANRVATLDSVVKVVISLDQNSPTNNEFDTFLLVDKFKYLKAPLKIIVYDNNNGKASPDVQANQQAAFGAAGSRSLGTSFISSTAFIEGYPEVVFDNDVVDREWTFQCLSYSLFKVGEGASLRQELLNTGGSGLLESIAGKVSSTVSTAQGLLSNVTKMF